MGYVRCKWRGFQCIEEGHLYCGCQILIYHLKYTLMHHIMQYSELVLQDRAVAFESWKLNVTENCYSAHEKEMVAVLNCIWYGESIYLEQACDLNENVANTYFKTQRSWVWSRPNGRSLFSEEAQKLMGRHQNGCHRKILNVWDFYCWSYSLFFQDSCWIVLRNLRSKYRRMWPAN